MPRESILSPADLFSAAFDTDGPKSSSLADHFHALGQTDKKGSVSLDVCMIDKMRDLITALGKSQMATEALKELVDKLSEEPWQCATLLCLLDGQPDKIRAEVLVGDRRCIVGIVPEISIATLGPGDTVLLNRQGSAIMAKGRSVMPGGMLGTFVRWEGQRVYVEISHEQFLMEALPTLASTKVEPGDFIRVHCAQHLAFEKVERPSVRREEPPVLPDVTAAHIGGQQQNYRKLKLALSASLMHREKASRYGLSGRHSILLIGPPGTGKTLMVRTAAAELQREYGVRCSFEVIKPGEFNVMWHGETERNIRNRFTALQRLADETEGMVVVYFDEIESIGRHRATGVGHADDKALTALLTEIDGFSNRRNICIVSSTNRKDLVDAALLERVSGSEIVVARPNALAAREIFGIHLPPNLPYCPNGSAAAATRRELIDAGVSRLFAPNAPNRIAIVRFTDGKQREVFAREMVSGRSIAQICESARLRAFERDRATDEAGLCAMDIEEACDEAIEKMRTTLSRNNAHAYLPDLPQDVNVLAVDPAVRVVRQHRYLNPNSNSNTNKP